MIPIYHYNFVCRAYNKTSLTVVYVLEVFHDLTAFHVLLFCDSTQFDEIFRIVRLLVNGELCKE